MTYDVIVVGAGPAGSTAAKLLAEKKINVLILDKATFLRATTADDGAPPVRRGAPRRAAPMTFSAPGDGGAGGFFGSGQDGAAGGRGRAPQPARTGGDDAPVKTVRRDEPKVGRNDPCPYGSGKKYKKCHGAQA